MNKQKIVIPSGIGPVAVLRMQYMCPVLFIFLILNMLCLILFTNNSAFWILMSLLVSNFSI